MTSVAAIVLAAGQSRRMGAQNKLLIALDGQPMVRRVVQTYVRAIPGPVVVVTGFERDRLQAALTAMPVSFAHNPAFATGQQTSVAVGLRAAPDAALLLVGLADQPALTAEELDALIARHRAGDPEKISVPMREGQRGNPIVIPRGLRARLTHSAGQPGCKRFTRDHPQHVQFVEMATDGFFTDIDRPADTLAFLSRQTEPMS